MYHTHARTHTHARNARTHTYINIIVCTYITRAYVMHAYMHTYTHVHTRVRAHDTNITFRWFTADITRFARLTSETTQNCVRDTKQTRNKSVVLLKPLRLESHFNTGSSGYSSPRSPRPEGKQEGSATRTTLEL